MALRVSRREFPGALRIGAGFCVFSGGMPFASEPRPFSKSPFRVAYINDEMSEDFGQGRQISRQFGSPRVIDFAELTTYEGRTR
jgi:hypothetical protein